MGNKARKFRCGCGAITEFAWGLKKRRDEQIGAFWEGAMKVAVVAVVEVASVAVGAIVICEATTMFEIVNNLTNCNIVMKNDDVCFAFFRIAT